MILPGPGSEFNLASAATDNDEGVRTQGSDSGLRMRQQATSPYPGGEAAWKFGPRSGKG